MNQNWKTQLPRSPSEIRDEFLCVWPTPDPGWEEAVKLWCRYHVYTELYDRHLVRVSGGHYTRNGTAIPHRMDLCGANAHQERANLFRIAGEEEAEIPRSVIEDARKYVLEWSFEDMWRYIMPGTPCPEP